jgi:hypothetical protein
VEVGDSVKVVILGRNEAHVTECRGRVGSGGLGFGFLLLPSAFWLSLLSDVAQLRLRYYSVVYIPRYLPFNTYYCPSSYMTHF